jgi:hypothetical protein
MLSAPPPDNDRTDTVMSAMERGTAYEIVDYRTQSHDGAQLHKADALAPGVADVVARLAEAAESAVQRHDDGLNDLLVTQGSWLWRITVTEECTEVEQLPLLPLVARLRPRQHYEVRKRGPLQDQVRVTTYTLHIANLDGSVHTLEVAGVEGIGAGLSGGDRTDRNERFGRAVAAALGWRAA